MVQLGAFFGVVWKALLEYIWNSLDNPNDDQRRVEVRIEFLDWSSKPRRRVRISDNARGMSAEEVKTRFLDLFGENQQRARGKQVRGYFGTGKTAFLSIADTLDLTTVRDGRRTRIRLRKELIERSGGHPRAEVLEDSVPTTEPNGTIVVIEDIHRNVRFQPDHVKEKRRIINDVGRKLADNDIIYHGAALRYTEPTPKMTWDFPFVDPLFGDVVFTVKEAHSPLDEDEGGFSVFTGGARREVTFLGFEGNATARRLWGYVEAPLLDNPNDEVPVATNARDRLNPENPRVAALHEFMRGCVETVIAQIEAARRDALAEEARREVQAHAVDIQRIINQDYLEQETQLLAAEASGGHDVSAGRTRSLTRAPGSVPIQSDNGPAGAEAAPEGMPILAPSGEPGDALEGAAESTGIQAGAAAAAAPYSGQAGGNGDGAGGGGGLPAPEEASSVAPGTDETASEASSASTPNTAAGAEEQSARQSVTSAPRRETPLTPPPLSAASVGLQAGSQVTSGGFRVEIAPYGHDLWRAFFFPDQRLIQVNLDYPSVKEAREANGVTGPFFKALEYEAAFSEYATALTRQVIASGRNADVATPEGAVKFVWETLNRLSRHTAPLYAAAARASPRGESTESAENP